MEYGFDTPSVRSVQARGELARLTLKTWSRPSAKIALLSNSLPFQIPIKRCPRYSQSLADVGDGHVLVGVHTFGRPHAWVLRWDGLPPHRCRSNTSYQSVIESRNSFLRSSAWAGRGESL